MAYSELIKNFNRIREYMRDFFVYGFKSREEYTGKSARSYDDERRRLESWLGEYMGFRQTPDGKNVFLSIDSRISRRNPLYKAWKTKSFTDGDITLHFILFDLLYAPEIALTLNEIMEKIDAYLENFDDPKVFDASTVRKKLKEYASEGIIVSEKRGKALYYRRAGTVPDPGPYALDFFSETAPCGVIGSYLQDKTPDGGGLFAFKHHYITGAMDSEIVCQLFDAMSEKRFVTLTSISRRKNRIRECRVVPLRILISVQSGRQYLMAYFPRFDRITSFRTDNIQSVKLCDECSEFDRYRKALDNMAPFMWGVSTQSRSGDRLEHVEFTVRYDPGETHIHQRLEREKRCGRVEKPDENTSRFSADVYDATELVPWMRTFICRITDVSFSDKAIEARFLQDIREMYALYGLEGGENG